MSHTTVNMKIVIGIAIALCIAPMTLLQTASGQFAPIESGTVYTSEDIATGKTDHLSEIQPFEITSESMFPLFKVGEMATMNYSVPFETIEEGDIIVFDSPVGHVSHRVIDIEESEEDGSRIITTLGDNNDGISIPGVDTDITADRYVGKVIVQEEA